MLAVADVIEALAALGDRSAVWDPYGLQLGDESSEVRRVGVCHEVSSEVVEKASAVDLLITYHPLLFKPVNRLTAGPGPSGRAYRLIRDNVSLAVVHTAWDSAPGGTADALAAAVGLRETEPFGQAEAPGQWKLVTFVPPEGADLVANALAAVGVGRIGNYSACSFRSEGVGSFFAGAGASPAAGQAGVMNRVAEVRIEMLVPAGKKEAAVAALVAAHPYEEPTFDLYQTESTHLAVGRIGSLSVQLSDLVDQLRSDVGAEVRAAGSQRTVTRVAVIPGSGGSFIREASIRQADVLVTGDVSHHQMREALDLGLAVIDVGHAPSERPGVAALTEAVTKIGPELVDVDVDPTPWRAARS